MSKLKNVRTGSTIKVPTQSDGIKLGDNSIATSNIQDNAISKNKLALDVQSQLGNTTTVKNYITNADFATSTGGWNTYNDGANAIPIDGTGGTASTILNITTLSTEALRTLSSMKISKLAGDKQGEGFSTDITIDPIDKNKALHVSFDYKFLNTNYVSGDLKVYVYDVDNATLLGTVSNDSQGDILSHTGEGTTFKATFYTTNSLNYRLIFHNSSTNASAWDMILDNVRVNPDVSVPGVIITEWQDYTPSSPWSGTHTGKWRRVGENIEIMFLNILTDVPSGVLNILESQLLNGLNLTIDQSKLPDTGDSAIAAGTAQILDAGNQVYTGNVRYAKSSRIFKISGGSSASGLKADVSATAPFNFGIGDKIGMAISLPIVGWSSGASLSTTEASFSTVKARYKHSLGDSISDTTETILNFNIKDYDTHNTVTTGASWKFTAPKTGYYRITSMIMAAANTLWGESEIFQISAYVDGTQTTFLGRKSGLNSSAGSSTNSVNGSTTLFLNKGQELHLSAYHNAGSSVTLTTDSRFSWITIEEVPDFSTFSVFGQSELVKSTGSNSDVIFTANVWQDFTSITLTPGEWNISAVALIRPRVSMSIRDFLIRYDSSSGNTTTIPSVKGENTVSYVIPGNDFVGSELVINDNITLTDTTTIYLKAMSNVSNTASQVESDYYSIKARRIK